MEDEWPLLRDERGDGEGNDQSNQDVCSHRILLLKCNPCKCEAGKVVGSGAAGLFGPFQVYEVSLSADGKKAIVGGNSDNRDVGAAWVFVAAADASIPAFSEWALMALAAVLALLGGGIKATRTIVQARLTDFETW